jgi:hypothetical protein
VEIIIFVNLFFVGFCSKYFFFFHRLDAVLDHIAQDGRNGDTD